jgi:hypothetical protein
LWCLQRKEVAKKRKKRTPRAAADYAATRSSTVSGFSRT